MARQMEMTGGATPVAAAAPRRGAMVLGTVHGLAAGAVMGVFLSGAHLFAGEPPSHPFLAVATTFVGPGALAGGAAVWYGIALHLLVSAVLGIVFHAIVPADMPFWSGVGIGLGFALLALGVLATCVPSVNPGFRPEVQHMGGTWVIAHMVYGVVLGALLGARSPAAKA